MPIVEQQETTTWQQHTASCQLFQPPRFPFGRVLRTVIATRTAATFTRRAVAGTTATASATV